MKKLSKIRFEFFFCIGLIIWFVTLVIPPVLPDFVSGLLAGMSTVFILIGLAYIAWCLGKKKNPFSVK